MNTNKHILMGAMFAAAVMMVAPSASAQQVTGTPGSPGSPGATTFLIPQKHETPAPVSGK